VARPFAAESEKKFFFQEKEEKSLKKLS